MNIRYRPIRFPLLPPNFAQLSPDPCSLIPIPTSLSDQLDLVQSPIPTLPDSHRTHRRKHVPHSHSDENCFSPIDRQGRIWTEELCDGDSRRRIRDMSPFLRGLLKEGKEVNVGSTNESRDPMGSLPGFRRSGIGRTEGNS